jgi:hypothetical protein
VAALAFPAYLDPEAAALAGSVKELLSNVVDEGSSGELILSDAVDQSHIEPFEKPSRGFSPNPSKRYSSVPANTR